MQVDVVVAKKRLSRLIAAAQRGEEVIIVHRGEPIARLAPAGKPSSATAETSTGHAILDWLAAHPLPVYARRSAEEIDAAIDDGKGSWG